MLLVHMLTGTCCMCMFKQGMLRVHVRVWIYPNKGRCVFMCKRCLTLLHVTCFDHHTLAIASSEISRKNDLSCHIYFKNHFHCFYQDSCGTDKTTCRLSWTFIALLDLADVRPWNIRFFFLKKKSCGGMLEKKLNYYKNQSLNLSFL